jgi:hypothetical protein
VTAPPRPPQAYVADVFAGLAAELTAVHPDVQPSRMFGSSGLKIHGKTFAMVVNDHLVVKMPASGSTNSSRPAPVSDSTPATSARCGSGSPWRPPAHDLSDPASRPCDDRRVTVPVQELVAEGRAALRRGEAADARLIFERAPTEPASGDVLEGLARAAYLEREFTQAIKD